MEYQYIDASQLQQSQQNPQEQPMPYYQPPQSPIDDVTLVTQTNPQPLIIELSHKLKCEIEVEENGQKKWIRPKGIEPLLNDKGIYSLLVDVGSIVNQCTILSWLEERDVENITIEIGKTVTFKLAMNWKEYELKKSNLTTVVFAVTNLCYTALKRGMNQGERTFLKTAVRSTEHMIINPKGQSQFSPVEKKWWQIWK